jgi:hypothetical protein
MRARRSNLHLRFTAILGILAAASGWVGCPDAIVNDGSGGGSSSVSSTGGGATSSSSSSSTTASSSSSATAGSSSSTTAGSSSSSATASSSSSTTAGSSSSGSSSGSGACVGDPVGCGAAAIWSKQFQNVTIAALAADSGGNVVLTGALHGPVNFGGGSLVSAGQDDVVVAKLNAGGGLVFAKNFGDATDQWGLGVAVDANGDVLLTGFFNGTLDFGPPTAALTTVQTSAFVAMLGPDGTPVWSTQFTGNNTVIGRSIAATASGVLVSGDFYGSPGG